MVTTIYKQDAGDESTRGADASNSGLRKGSDLNVNGAVWTKADVGIIGGPSFIGGSSPVVSQVLGSMHAQLMEAMSPATSQLRVKRVKELDSFKYASFKVTLFYEGKELCLALSDAETEMRLGLWTFCRERRSQRLFEDDDFSVRVYYRPASVEVVFNEKCRKGFLKRWFGSSLESKDTWSAYELECNGTVRINRPGKEFLVS